MIYELTTLFRETVDKPIWEVEKDLKEFESSRLFEGKSLKDIIEFYESFKEHTQANIESFYSNIAKESFEVRYLCNYIRLYIRDRERIGRVMVNRNKIILSYEDCMEVFLREDTQEKDCYDNFSKAVNRLAYLITPLSTNSINSYNALVVGVSPLNYGSYSVTLSDIYMDFIKRNYNRDIIIALNNRLSNLKDVWGGIDTEKVTYKNVLKELREMTLNELVDMETKTTSLISIKEVISLTYSREEVEEVTLLPLAKEMFIRYTSMLRLNNKIQLFDSVDKEIKEIEKLKLSRGERYKETFDEMYEKLGFKSCLSMLYIKTDRAINLENQLLERYDYVIDIEDIDGEDRDIIDNLIDSVLDFINYAVMLEVLIRGGSNKNS